MGKTGLPPVKKVSIHAHHYWRAIPVGVVFMIAVKYVFQSTPTITGGRFGADATLVRPSNWFQSTPTITGGRFCPGCGAALHRHMFQSTPTITGGRFAGSATGRGGAGGFNPRPPLLAGDSSRHLRIGHLALVSIHAHHYWRAIRRLDIPDLLGLKFQTTPTITGGRFLRISASSNWTTPAWPWSRPATTRTAGPG